MQGTNRIMADGTYNSLSWRPAGMLGGMCIKGISRDHGPKRKIGATSADHASDVVLKPTSKVGYEVLLEEWVGIGLPVAWERACDIQVELDPLISS